MLESELVYFVLGFESQNLIVCILAEPLCVVSLLVHLLYFLHSLRNFTVVPFVDPLLVS